MTITDTASASAYAAREREYVETIASLRHYSQLRFTVLSVFYAATAALVVGAFGISGIDGVSFPTHLSLVLKALGVLVTVILFTYDFMIDGYQAAFRKHLAAIWPESHWFKRPKFGLFFQVPVWLLYALMLALWIAAIMFDPSLPARISLEAL